ncbi:hypothetical protein VTN96DRAFT_10092 [Rasamsonia emersonii]
MVSPDQPMTAGIRPANFRDFSRIEQNRPGSGGCSTCFGACLQREYPRDTATGSAGRNARWALSILPSGTHLTERSYLEYAVLGKENSAAVGAELSAGAIIAYDCYHVDSQYYGQQGLLGCQIYWSEADCDGRRGN